jgi:hypothetical protein
MLSKSRSNCRKSGPDRHLSVWENTGTEGVKDFSQTIVSPPFGRNDKGRGVAQLNLLVDGERSRSFQCAYSLYVLILGGPKD